MCLTLSLAANLAASGASGEPNKEQHELQERCGKRAEQIFRSDNPSQAGGGVVTNTKDSQNITTYQNHYSATLNKCLYLLIVTGINYKTQPRYTTTLMTLFDINENKEYGTFFKRSDDGGPAQCNVQQKACHSESEWQELLTPYMEQ